jgi:hypothetical protein
MAKNPASAENGRKGRFTSDKQPPNRGRKRSVFGPLEWENDLSLDDVRKVFKNILTAKGFDKLNEVNETHPTVLTSMTIAMLRQDYLGKLTGRKVTIEKPTGKKDENGEEIKEQKVVDERIKSFETIKYMLDRCFGEPARADDTALQSFIAPAYYEGDLADDPS